MHARRARRRAAATSGIASHWPSCVVRARLPRAALTVKISRSATWPVARAWVIWWPGRRRRSRRCRGSTARWRRRGTGRWPTRPGARSCPRAPRWRRRARSRRRGTRRGCEIAGVTGRTQRWGLCVASRPSQVRASTGGEPSAMPHATPWLGDACSLVDAFRAGERSPVEELEAVPRRHRGQRRSTPSPSSTPTRRVERAAAADVSLPFGGVPVGVKELDYVEGWPSTEASLVFRGPRRPTYTSHDAPAAVRRRRRQPGRADDGVGVRRAQRLDHEAQRHHPQPVAARAAPPAGPRAGRRPRWPAASCPSPAAATAAARSASRPASTASLGMKGTAGRIPRGPDDDDRPDDGRASAASPGRCATSPAGTTSCAGYDNRDPYSLPRIDGWERDLGTHRDALRGKRVVIAPTLGSAVVRPEVEERVRAAAEALAARRRPRARRRPVSSPASASSGRSATSPTLLAELGDLWPGCKDELTAEIAFGLEFAGQVMNLETAADGRAGPHRGERGDGRGVRRGRLRHRRHQPRRRLPGRGDAQHQGRRRAGRARRTTAP